MIDLPDIGERNWGALLNQILQDIDNQLNGRLSEEGIRDYISERVVLLDADDEDVPLGTSAGSLIFRKKDV